MNNFPYNYYSLNNSIIDFRKFNNTKELSTFMLNEEFYSKLLVETDFLDNPRPIQFNDLEMVYLFVHNKKDMNDKKNRMTNTKQEGLSCFN